MSVVSVSGSKQLNQYDPDKGLKSIAVAEAGEKHFARAKDATGLYEAIEAKLFAQAEYVVWRDGVSQHGGDRKSSLQNSKLDLPASDPGAAVVHRWRKRLCVKTQAGTAMDAEKMRRAKDDAARRATRICEQEKDGTIRGTEGTGEFERYTPSEYIEAARLALGEIDLDPASNEIAQKTVRAAKYFIADDDGLSQDWHGRVWLNPPYHRDLAPKFIDKLVSEFASGRIQAAIALTNNCTDTEWFSTALEECAAICFTRGRIKFTQPDGTEVLPTQGQAFFYFGDNVTAFERAFSQIGFGVKAIWL